MSDVQTPAPAEETHADWKPAYNPWLIAVVVTLAAFMEILDTTIVNVALPHIAGSLSASNDEATWALTSYLVANGIVLTISGWLGDLLGRKRYFLICIGMFTVCSFLCGISDSLSQLIMFRLAQGFFGGGLQPNQQAIILDTFPPAKRAAAFGVTAIATIVAPVLGPTLGGYITDDATWRWIFFINVPVGAFAVFVISIVVEDPPWERNKKKNPDDRMRIHFNADSGRHPISIAHARSFVHFVKRDRFGFCKCSSSTNIANGIPHLGSSPRSGYKGRGSSQSRAKLGCAQYACSQFIRYRRKRWSSQRTGSSGSLELSIHKAFYRGTHRPH